MKIQLDTTNKTIKIEEQVNFGELFDFLNSILPNDSWKEYFLEVGVIQNWNNPIYVPYSATPTIYPWTTVGSIYTQTSGVYNIDVK